MKKVLVVDNDDSFVYNIVEMLRHLCHVEVVNHRELMSYRVTDFDGVVLSPGAGLPSEYPQIMEFLSHYAGRCSILGVCLGHQAIAQHFGATLVQLSSPKHAHCSRLVKCELGLLESVTEVGRYHSWVVSMDEFPVELVVTSRDEEGHIMSLRHGVLPIYGVQFHPESIITTSGRTVFAKWLDTLSR